jgi:hypothetical protein
MEPHPAADRLARPCSSRDVAAVLPSRAIARLGLNGCLIPWMPIELAVKWKWRAGMDFIIQMLLEFRMGADNRND